MSILTSFPVRVIIEKALNSDEVWADMIVDFEPETDVYDIVDKIDRINHPNNWALAWERGECFTSYLSFNYVPNTLDNVTHLWKFCRPGSTEVLVEGMPLDQYLVEKPDGTKELRLQGIKLPKRESLVC